MVLDPAQEEAHDEHDYGVADEKEAGAGGQILFARIGVEIGDHAGVGDAHQEHEKADRQHVGVHRVAQLEGRLFLIEFRRVAQYERQHEGDDIGPQGDRKEGVIANIIGQEQAHGWAEGGSQGRAEGEVAGAFRAALLGDDGLGDGHQRRRGERIARAVKQAHQDQDGHVMRHEIAHRHDADEGQRGQGGALLPHAVHQPAGDDAHECRAQNEGARGKTTDGIGCPEALDGIEGHGRHS